MASRRRTPKYTSGTDETSPSPTQSSVVRFDTSFVGILLWFIAGVLLDGRSHTHGTEETFFTLEHGIFYSAFIALSFLMGYRIWSRRQETDQWRAAIPAGYGLSLIGIVLFALGGVGDLLWHELFGVEADIEALLSPTHLLLVVGAGLFVSGPLRSALRYENVDGRILPRFLPVLTATIVLSLITFITLYLNPVTEPVASTAHPAASRAVATGLAGILVTTVALMGFVLFLLIRFELPFGSFAFLFGGNALAMAIVDGHLGFVIVFTVSGILADALRRIIEPSLARPWRFRAFAAAAPMILFGLYFFGIIGVTGVAWTIHLWAGAIVSAGLVGLLLSSFVELVQLSYTHQELQ